MAEKELASKLAKRIQAMGQDDVMPCTTVAPPPVPPSPPKEHHPNPYVAKDEGFSIDALVSDFIERNNNKEISSPTHQQECSETRSSPTPPVHSLPSHCPSEVIKSRIAALSSAPKSLPTAHPAPIELPKEEEAPHSTETPTSICDPPLTPQSKRPLVRIEHHRPTTPIQKLSRGFSTDDGLELARRLEQQRQKKKEENCDPPVNYDPILQEIERLEYSSEGSEPSKNSCSAPFPPPPSFKPPPIPDGPPSESTYPSFPPLPPSIAPPPAPLPASLPPTLDSPFSPPPPCQLSATRAQPPSPPPKLSAVAIVPRNMMVSSQPSTVVTPLPALETPSDSSVGKPSPGGSSSAATDDSDELAAKLARRNLIIDGYFSRWNLDEITQAHIIKPEMADKKRELAPEMGATRRMGIYHEFPEFSRKQLKYFTETFKKFDEDGDNFIDFMELKRMMEKLGEPQTHITLKQIIKKVDEDEDGKVSLREFLLIFKHAAAGELGVSSEVFRQLADSVDVTKEGVHGAAEFFQAKGSAYPAARREQARRRRRFQSKMLLTGRDKKIAEQTKTSRFEEEIRQEQSERKAAEEEKKQRRQKFLQSKSLFH